MHVPAIARSPASAVAVGISCSTTIMTPAAATKTAATARSIAVPRVIRGRGRSITAVRRSRCRGIPTPPTDTGEGRAVGPRYSSTPTTSRIWARASRPSREISRIAAAADVASVSNSPRASPDAAAILVRCRWTSGDSSSPIRTRSSCTASAAVSSQVLASSRFRSVNCEWPRRGTDTHSRPRTARRRRARWRSGSPDRLPGPSIRAQPTPRTPAPVLPAPAVRERNIRS